MLSFFTNRTHTHVLLQLGYGEKIKATIIRSKIEILFAIDELKTKRGALIRD